MGVQIIDRKYTHLGRPSDNNITWLLGNVGVWQKLTLTCEFEVAINFSSTNVLFMEEPNIFTLGDGSEWRDHGFEVGDSFEVKWATTDDSNNTLTYNVFGTIQSLNGSEMRSSNGTLGGGAQASNIYPYQGAEIKAHSVFIKADKQPQGIRFQYGHLKNSESDSINLKSFIDGTATEFEIEDTHLMTIGQIRDFDFVGLQSGMSVASCKLEYVSQQSSKYIYNIDIIFMVSSFFDDLNNLINLVSPNVNYDKECLTDNFIVTGFPTYNNPNIKISNDPKQTKRLGNTGWFNENFNGLPNPFVVSSITYTNLSQDIVSQLDYANPILVTAVIDNIQNLSTQTRCMFGFSWTPIDEEDYKSQVQGNQYQTGYFKNVLINTGGAAVNFGDVFNVSNTIDSSIRQGYSNQDARMDVQNVRFQQTGPSQITFQAEFVPNSDFTTFMENKDVSERSYILWVSVADQNEITNDSDRVSLLIDQIRQLDTFIEPIGEWPGMEISFFDHTQDETSEPCPCGNDWRIEDEVLSMIDFGIDTSQGPTIPIPTGITYGVVIKRISDEYTYELDRYKVDLTQYPNPTQFNFDDSKGFKLPSGNNKNWIKVDYYPTLDVGSTKGVRGFYGFKIRWEDWLERFGVPQEVIDDYYDNTEKANGLNNDWYHYLSNNGWQLSFVVYIDASLNGQSVRYENLKELDFADYDSNDNVTTEIRYYRDLDNTQLIGGTDPETGKPLGVLLSTELVRLEIDYILGVGVWGDLSDIYGINTIEVFEGAGQLEYRQLSTEYAPESDNPLLPLVGNTVLDMQIINPTTLRFSCLVDYTKLIPANKYKITGREGCKSEECGGIPKIYLSSTKNTTTNTSTDEEGLIAAPNVFATPDNFAFSIDSKNSQGASYVGEYEVTAQAFRQDGTMFSLGRAVYNSGQNANTAPVLSDATWNSWGGGSGLHSYFIGTWSDGSGIGFRKITFSKNNVDPSLLGTNVLQNENSVYIKLKIVIKENCTPSEGEGGIAYLLQTIGNSENNANTSIFGNVNGDWQTERQADTFLSGYGVGNMRGFYVDPHPDADYIFTGYALNETTSGAGDNSIKLSEALKDRSGNNWRNIWTYSDSPFRLAAIRGGFGTNTQTRIVYACQIDSKDTLNIHNGTQYSTLFTAGSGTLDIHGGRKLYLQPIIGYTDGTSDTYINTKGLPIFGESQEVFGTGIALPGQLGIHSVIEDWRHNDRPILMFYLLGNADIVIQYNTGTYAATFYDAAVTGPTLGILGRANTVHYCKADGCIYAYTREVVGGITTNQRLYKIEYTGGGYDIGTNYTATLIFLYSYATGTELSRSLSSTTGTFDNYPYGISNFVASDNLIENGYPVFYLQDMYGNCVVEVKNNGGNNLDTSDWDYEVVAGVFGHGNPTPSRSNGIGPSAEFDFLGDLNQLPAAIIGSSYSRMFDGKLYLANRNRGHMAIFDPTTRVVFYLSGEFGDTGTGALTIV